MNVVVLCIEACLLELYTATEGNRYPSGYVHILPKRGVPSSNPCRWSWDFEPGYCGEGNGLPKDYSTKKENCHGTLDHASSLDIFIIDLIGAIFMDPINLNLFNMQRIKE